MPRDKGPARPRKPAAEAKLSRLKKPVESSVEDWQIGLRRQFGREQAFRLENLGGEPVFSEFAVTNPQSGGRYRVAIRGAGLGENFCSCPDFATNDLGTCKHIEFTLARLRAQRGGVSALLRGFRPAYSEIYLNYAGARGLRFRAGTDCPPALAGQGAALFDPAQSRPLRAEELEAFLQSAGRTEHEVRCYDDALGFVAETRDAEQRGKILDAAYPDGSRSAALAGLLQIGLYPYQAEGALFAARAGRALIGDEMGLGKTAQAIAAAELMARHFGVERVLVVCPTSLKHQWQREIARFSGRDAQTIQGLRPLRQQQYREDGFCKITNYETLARDLDLIRSWAPDLLIVDEAQRIKNWNTVAARSLKRIDSPYAVVLTGTPLENRLEELISIVQFVDRHRRGPTWRLLHEHQKRDDSGRVVGYQGLDRLGATLSPILLRRRKAEVLEQLPERVDNTLFLPMTPEQRTHHDENGDIVTRIVHRWRKTGFLSDADQRRLTCALQNMRMSCNSTFLLDKETDHGCKADELATLLEELFERPDAKAVVFSQWLRSHEILIRRLEARGWGYVLFHGGVPGDKRGALVDRFCNDAGCRVFLSTDAGGVGLNLQHAAATVINMDLPWNPAVLEQRIGRVYRLGQKRSVQVVNLVAQGTIEEGMLSVLAFKKSLFAGVLDRGESEVFLHGTRLSQFMESVEEATGAMGAAEPAADASQTEAEARFVPPSGEEEGGVPEAGSAAETPGGSSVQGARSPAGADLWAALLDVGVQFAQALNAARDVSEGRPSSHPWIEADGQTGKPYLKLPVPEPETVQRLAETLAGLLGGLRR